MTPFQNPISIGSIGAACTFINTFPFVNYGINILINERVVIYFPVFAIAFT